LSTHVNNIRTSGQHGFRMLDCLLWLQVQPTVREGIGRHIQNAHDVRTLLEVAYLVAQDELGRGVRRPLESLLQRYHEGLQDRLLLLPQAADQGGRTTTEQIMHGRCGSGRAIAPVPWTLLAQPVHEPAGSIEWHGEELADQPSVAVPKERVRGLMSHTGQLMGDQGIIALG